MISPLPSDIARCAVSPLSVMKCSVTIIASRAMRSATGASTRSAFMRTEYGRLLSTVSALRAPFSVMR